MLALILFTGYNAAYVKPCLHTAQTAWQYKHSNKRTKHLFCYTNKADGNQTAGCFKYCNYSYALLFFQQLIHVKQVATAEAYINTKNTRHLSPVKLLPSGEGNDSPLS
jgi:hypothetical protein